MEYGNLAYKYDYDYDIPIKEKRPQKKPDRIKNAKNHSRNAAARKKRHLSTMAAIIMMAASATYMISRFVQVNETEQQLAALEKELAQAQAYTSQKVFELEQSVDLTEIEKEATTRLNMQRPENYQTIYIDVKQDDMTEITANSVESLPNRILAGFKKIGEYIVNLFSIK